MFWFPLVPCYIYCIFYIRFFFHSFSFHFFLVFIHVSVCNPIVSYQLCNSGKEVAVVLLLYIICLIVATRRLILLSKISGCKGTCLMVDTSRRCGIQAMSVNMHVSHQMSPRYHCFHLDKAMEPLQRTQGSHFTALFSHNKQAVCPELWKGAYEQRLRDIWKQAQDTPSSFWPTAPLYIFGFLSASWNILI